jgi:hypothetical protein
VGERSQEGINMWALNCPAWRLQDSLLAAPPVVSANDKYTAMVWGLMHLAGCFHPDTHEFLGAPHPKMVECNVWLWVQRSKSQYPEKEEKACSNMVAFVNPLHGSFVHRFVSMVLLKRRLALALRLLVWV